MNRTDETVDDVIRDMYCDHAIEQGGYAYRIRQYADRLARARRREWRKRGAEATPPKRRGG